MVSVKGFVAASLTAVGVLVTFNVSMVSAQCYDCLNDIDEGTHRMSYLAPPLGWYESPNSFHLNYLDGHCMWYHTFGCGEEDEVLPDLVDQVAESDGQALRTLMRENPESLTLNSDEGVVEVVGCGGHVILELPLRETQKEALGVNQAPVTDDPGQTGNYHNSLVNNPWGL